MEMRREYDPQAPFIAEDGYEYENLAAYLVGEKANCWRNNHIEASRKMGVAEATIRKWVEAFDGEDRTPTICQDAVAVRALRAAQANAAVDPLFARSLQAHAPNAGDDYHHHLGNVFRTRRKPGAVVASVDFCPAQAVQPDP